MSIPKIIHQIWIGPNPEPTIWTNTIKKNYIKEHPSWDYKLWNNDNINELFINFPIIKIVYDLTTKWSGKSDILRYLILYKYGGLYIDADSVWVNNKSFDILLECKESIFAAREPHCNHITGGVIGSCKNHKVFLDILNEIEHYVKNNNSIKKKKYIKICTIKGYSKLLGPILFNKHAINYDIKIYPSEYFYPISWHNIKDINYHLKNKLPEDSFMFQYGYTTNNFKNIIG